jgi:glucose dehydrogenase
MKGFGAFLLAAAMIALSASPATAQSGTGWGVYGGDQANTRYNGLSKVNTSNAQQLKVAWAPRHGGVEGETPRRPVGAIRSAAAGPRSPGRWPRCDADASF